MHLRSKKPLDQSRLDNTSDFLLGYGSLESSSEYISLDDLSKKINKKTEEKKSHLVFSDSKAGSHVIDIDTDNYRGEKFLNLQMDKDLQKLETEIDSVFALFREMRFSPSLLLGFLTTIASTAAAIAMEVLASEDADLGPLFAANAAGLAMLLFVPTAFALACVGGSPGVGVGIILGILLCIMQLEVSDYYGEFPFLAEGAGSCVGLAMVAPCIGYFFEFDRPSPNNHVRNLVFAQQDRRSAFSPDEEGQITDVLSRAGVSLLNEHVRKYPGLYDEKLQFLATERNYISILRKDNNLLRYSIFQSNDLHSMPKVVNELILDYAVTDEFDPKKDQESSLNNR